jgi:formylglycine-generating enzyme required for sulfatase activity
LTKTISHNKNEFSISKTKRVDPFLVSKFKVTNEEYLEFIVNDGYKKREFWSDEGWEWLQFRKTNHPLFWRCPNHCENNTSGQTLSHYINCDDKIFSKEELESYAKLQNKNDKTFQKNVLKRRDENGNEIKFPFKLRLMFDNVEMPFNWPVEVNFHEAKAFTKWKGIGYRLISEAEHHAMRDYDISDLNPKSDVIFQGNKNINHDLHYGSSTVL